MIANCRKIILINKGGGCFEKRRKSYIGKHLKDCGCAKEIIASCPQIKEKYGEQEILPVLQQERYRLLQKIHGEQQKLDILDYVIFKLKQGGLKDV